MRRRVYALLACAASVGLAVAPGRLAGEALPDVVWSVGTPDRVAALAVSLDGSMVAVGIWDGTIRLLRASDGAQVRDLRASVYDRGLSTVAFSPDSSLLLSCMFNPDRESARLWRVPDGTLFRNLIGASAYTNCGAFSSDGERVACGRDAENFPPPGSVDKRTLQVWRPSTGTRLYDIEWSSSVTSIRYSPDGAYVVTTGYKQDYTRYGIWSAADFSLVHEFEALEDTVVWLYYTPDGRTLISAGTGIGREPSIRLRNTADWSLRHVLTGPKHMINSVAVAPDGSTLVCASGDWLRGRDLALTFWRIADGVEIASYTEGRQGVTAVAYTPDSAFIVCGWADGTVAMARNPFAPLTGSSLTVSDEWGQLGGTVSLAARLTNAGAPVVGRDVRFTVEGTVVGSGVTDTAGWTRVNYVVPDAGGTGMRPIQADFAGDASFGAATGYGTLHVLRTDTGLYTPDRTGAIGATCFLKGYLSRRTDRARLPGRPITFSVDGTVVGTAPTVGAGPAVLPYIVEEGSGAGERRITAEWAGDDLYGPSIGSSTLTALPGRLYIWVLQPRTAPVGGSVYLRAYVRSLPHYVWKAGLPITFSVDGTEVGIEITNAAGRASLLYAVPPGTEIGDHPFACSFAGNAAYAPTEQAGILTVTP